MIPRINPVHTHTYHFDGVTFEASKETKEFAEKMVADLSKIPTGRETLESLRKNGTCVYMDGAICRTATDKNMIYLSPRYSEGSNEYSLVLLAEVLKQRQAGLTELVDRKTDFASDIMVTRAEQANAAVHALKACKEWEAVEHYEPIDHFKDSYEIDTEAYDKEGWMSDAFKDFYRHARIKRDAERFVMDSTNLDVMISSTKPETERPVSVKPEEIAQYCGGDYVKGFNEFLNSKESRQVDLLTKTVFELYNEANAAKGGVRDPSVETMPATKRSLYTNLRYMREKFEADFLLDKIFKERSKDEIKEMRATRKIIHAAVKAADKIDAAEREGKTDPGAEKTIAMSKKKMAERFAPAQKKKSLQSLLSNLGAKKTAQTVALKKDNSR